jgi:hypothetical protein
MAQKKVILPVDEWEIWFSRAAVIRTLEKGDSATNSVFNVSFARGANEAAEFLREDDIDRLVRCWEGSEEELNFILAFIERY